MASVQLPVVPNVVKGPDVNAEVSTQGAQHTDAPEGFNKILNDVLATPGKEEAPHTSDEKGESKGIPLVEVIQDLQKKVVSGELTMDEFRTIVQFILSQVQPLASTPQGGVAMAGQEVFADNQLPQLMNAVLPVQTEGTGKGVPTPPEQSETPSEGSEPLLQFKKVMEQAPANIPDEGAQKEQGQLLQSGKGTTPAMTAVIDGKQAQASEQSSGPLPQTKEEFLSMIKESSSAAVSRVLAGQEQGTLSDTGEQSTPVKNSSPVTVPSHATPQHEVVHTNTAAQVKEAVPVSKISHLDDPIIKMVAAGEKHLIVKLDPPDLGSIRIKLSMESGVLKAELNVESLGTKDLLTQTIPQIRASLEHSGIKVSDFSVQVKEEHYSDFQKEGNQQPPHHEQQQKRKERDQESFFDLFA